jgi:hypothetical protein
VFFVESTFSFMCVGACVGVRQRPKLSRRPIFICHRVDFGSRSWNSLSGFWFPLEISFYHQVSVVAPHFDSLRDKFPSSLWFHLGIAVRFGCRRCLWDSRFPALRSVSQSPFWFTVFVSRITLVPCCRVSFLFFVCFPGTAQVLRARRFPIRGAVCGHRADSCCLVVGTTG